MSRSPSSGHWLSAASFLGGVPGEAHDVNGIPDALSAAAQSYGRSHSMTPPSRPSASDSDELLTAVDVKGPAGERGVGHDVDRECGDVSRPDDASDWQRRTELFAARVQLVAEEGRRQWCVDESRRNHVHADGCYFECEVFGHGGKRGCERRQ